MTTSDLERLIRAIPDFPIKGILFRDITPLLADKEAFAEAVELMAKPFVDKRIDIVVGIEARGYILGGAMAVKLGAGFVPVRKPGKLPYDKISEEYKLEYGTNTLEMHRDATGQGDRVLIVDDLLATGGTAAATRRLVAQVGAVVVGFSFLIELDGLAGRKELPGEDVRSVLHY